MVKMGIIGPVKEPTEWWFGMLIVTKPNGED